MRTFTRLQGVFGEHRVHIGQIEVPVGTASGEQVGLPIPYCRILSHNAAMEQRQGPKGPATAKERVIVDVTGTHGCEGAVGDKLVDADLNALADAAEHAKSSTGSTRGLAELPDGMGRLVIGPLNPKGMLEGMRTSGWADTNRNWGPPEVYDHVNLAYARIQRVLNPEGKAQYRNWTHAPYLFPLLRRLATEAFREGSLAKAEESMRAATLQGQSKEAPHGLFWIGDPSQPNKRNQKITQVLEQQLADAGAVMLTDWHTGYGKWGQLSVVAPKPTNGVGSKMREVAGDIDVGLASKRGGFYPMEGSFISHVAGLFPDKVVLPWIYEFGTMAGPRLPAAVEGPLLKAGLAKSLDKIYLLTRNLQSLQRMRLRHQGARFGFASDKDRDRVMRDFMDMFDPTSPEWWTAIVAEMKQARPGMIQRFVSMDLDSTN